MQFIIVKELMVPLESYATVSKDATLYEAVMALEEAQKNFDAQTSHPHRAILIFDENKKVVGKVSQLDVIRALEPKYDQVLDNHTARFGFSPQFLSSMLEHFQLWKQPLDSICKKASALKVKDFMYEPTKGEYVKEDATLNEAINQLVLGHHQSLLVTKQNKDDEIAGVLRLTDVFKEICKCIKSCNL